MNRINKEKHLMEFRVINKFDDEIVRHSQDDKGAITQVKFNAKIYKLICNCGAGLCLLNEINIIVPDNPEFGLSLGVRGPDIIPHVIISRVPALMHHLHYKIREKKRGRVNKGAIIKLDKFSFTSFISTNLG